MGDRYRYLSRGSRRGSRQPPIVVADPLRFAIHHWNGNRLATHFDTAGEHDVLARYCPTLQPLASSPRKRPSPDVAPAKAGPQRVKSAAPFTPRVPAFAGTTPSRPILPPAKRASHPRPGASRRTERGRTRRFRVRTKHTKATKRPSPVPRCRQFPPQRPPPPARAGPLRAVTATTPLRRRLRRRSGQALCPSCASCETIHTVDAARRWESRHVYRSFPEEKREP
jgi:hypothetical protein